MKKLSLFFYLFYLLLLSCSSSTSVSDWIPLFNGKDFSNWEIRNGTAEYLIEDEAIVGISKANTKNTFLCTREMYGDFILELEVKIDTLLNSGIQIRSNSLPEYWDGVVHGYQIEIDPSARAFSGGIYDESRRGWLYPLSENHAGRKAFKKDDWNQFRIEAIGPEIRVWVNGINTANLRDDRTAEGFIGLQVHSIQNEEEIGKKIRWRNIRIKTENLEAARWAIQENAREENLLAHHLTETEEQAGWQLLWDESKFEQGLPSGWRMQDRTLVASTAESFLPLRASEGLKNYELKVAFRLEEGAKGLINYDLNSEVLTAPAYTLINDAEAKDLEEAEKLAALYQRAPAKNLSVPGKGKYYRGTPYWNHARIVVRDKQIEHWLNGYLLLSYHDGTNNYPAQARQIPRTTIGVLAQEPGVILETVKFRKLPD